MKIGEFNLSVIGPYPVWIGIEKRGQEIQCSHSELQTLLFVVEEAIRQAKRNLPATDRHEVKK